MIMLNLLCEVKTMIMSRLLWFWWFIIFVGLILLVITWIRLNPTPEELKKRLKPMPQERALKKKLKIFGDAPKREALYNAAVQEAIHTDNLSWNRLYNFLTANSLLMLTWAAIFVSNEVKKLLVLSIISLFGFVLSFSWALFGSRGRRMHRYYTEVCRGLEGKPKKSSLKEKSNAEQQQCNGPLSADSKFKFLPIESFFTSNYFTILVPLIFAFVYWFILWIPLMP